MLTYDSVLKAALDNTGTKADWAAMLNQMLGATRRIRCFRDSNANAVNPFVTGTLFLDIGNTGTLTVADGAITSFGNLGGATTRQSADLTTGSSILRIEGNGYWVQGTLGLESQNADTDLTNDHDFTFNVNPTVKAGFGVSASIRAPRFLSSGTGPKAPPTDDQRPVIVELEDWRDPANPVIVGFLTLNVRDDDWVFEDAELAAEMGDVRVTKSAQSIIFSDFEFGATLLSMNPIVNSEAQATVHEVLIGCHPYQRWETYPAADTWNHHTASNPVLTGVGQGYIAFVNVFNDKSITETITVTVLDANTLSIKSDVGGDYGTTATSSYGTYIAPSGGFGFGMYNGPWTPGDKWVFSIKCTVSETRLRDVTVPPPFKINLRRLDNTLIHTFEMRDGLPINSPQLSQVRTADKPLRPVFNCGMLLPWRSNRQKMNSKTYKYYPGAVDSSVPGGWRVSMAKGQYASNPPVPLLYGGAQVNGFNHYFAAPKWAIGYGLTPANNALDPNNDPYTWDVTTFETYKAVDARGVPTRATGWGYEIGSISLHDWMSGPGGLRCDRVFLATPIALYLNNPNGLRARDNSTLLDNVEAWNNAYFNHSCHYLRDVKNFTTLPVDEVLFGKWAYGDPYYSQAGAFAYVPGGLTRHIAVNGVNQHDESFPKKDRTGFMTWNGWNPDDQHAYSTPGLSAIFFNSPMFAVGAKHRLIASTMAQMAGVDPTKVNDFMGRVIAWRWHQWAINWKIASKHNLGTSRALIEKRWQTELENIYRIYVLPATDPTNPAYNSDTAVGLRNLGIYASGLVTTDIRGSLNTWSATGQPATLQGNYIEWNALGYYMTGVFVFMKTTGSWNRMYNMSDTCKKSLDFMMLCYDKFAVEYILDAKGRAEGNYPSISKPIDVNAALDGSNAQAYKDFHTFPASWAEWATWYPAAGQEDWLHDANGNIIGRDAAQHARAQWAFMRRDFFPEFSYPRMDQAIAEYERYYQIKTASIAAMATPAQQWTNDWGSFYPGFARIKPPTVT